MKFKIISIVLVLLTGCNNAMTRPGAPLEMLADEDENASMYVIDNYDKYASKPLAKNVFTKFFLPDDKRSTELSLRTVQQEQLYSTSVTTLSANAAKELNSYIDGIVSKLLENWPHELPAPDIQSNVVREDRYGASMKSSNLLIVDFNVILNAQSEDEVAAVVAHELSHSLLHHFYADDRRKMWSEVYKTTGGVLLYTQLANEDLGAVVGLAVAMSAIEKIENSVFYSEWAAEQEDDADLLAIDLMQKAGYDWTQFITVLQRIEAQGDKTDRELKEAESEAKKKAQELSHSEDETLKAKAKDLLSKLSFKRKKEQEQKRQDIKDGKSGGLAMDSTKHHSASQRLNHVNSYIMKGYDDYEEPELETASLEKLMSSRTVEVAAKKLVFAKKAKDAIKAEKWSKAYGYANKALESGKDRDPQLRTIMYDIRKGQGKTKLAILNLEIAARSPTVPSNINTLLIEEYSEAKAWDKAINTSKKEIERSSIVSDNLEQNVARHINLLGNRAGENDEEEVNKYLTMCKEFDQSYIDSCQESLSTTPLGESLLAASESEEESIKDAEATESL